MAISTGIAVQNYHFIIGIFIDHDEIILIINSVQKSLSHTQKVITKLVESI